MTSLNVHVQMSLPGPLNSVEPQVIVDQYPPAIHTDTRRPVWKGSKCDAVELLYALQRIKCIEIDGQPADITSVSALFEKAFNFQLGNVYDVHLHNKRRKKDKAPFLHGLTDGYLASE